MMGARTEAFYFLDDDGGSLLRVDDRTQSMMHTLQMSEHNGRAF
jgi:nitrous oxide reductase accessory protein NosL